MLLYNRDKKLREDAAMSPNKNKILSSRYFLRIPDFSFRKHSYEYTCMTFRIEFSLWIWYFLFHHQKLSVLRNTLDSRLSNCVNGTYGITFSTLTTRLQFRLWKLTKDEAATRLLNTSFLFTFIFRIIETIPLNYQCFFQTRI